MRMEAETNLNNMQLRLDQEQSHSATQEQQFNVDLKAAMDATKQITIERDQLLIKIEHINHVNGEWWIRSCNM